MIHSETNVRPVTVEDGRAVELATRATSVRLGSGPAQVVAEYHRPIWVSAGGTRTRIVDYQMLARLMFALVVVSLMTRRRSRG